MNAPIDTLAFAERFESAGFSHEQARALALTFGEAQESFRDGLATKTDLDLGLSGLEGRLNKQFGELEARLNKQFGEVEARLNKQFGDLEVRLTRHVGDSAKEVTGRLWSTVAIISGVSTAISATVGAGVALVLKAKGL